MTGLFYEVVVAVFNAITSFLTADYFYSLFAPRNNKHKIATAIAFAVFVAAPLLLKMTVGNMVILAICMFVVSMNFDFKLYNKLLFSVFFVAINCLFEIAVVLLLALMSDSKINAAIEGVYLIFGTILCKFLFIVFCYIIGFVKKEILVGKFNLRWIPLYTLPVGTYIIVFALYRSLLHNNDPFISKLSLTGLILLIISNLLIIRLVNNIRESAINEQRLKTAEELVKHQEKQYALVLENNEKITKQRHDYKNFIIGVLTELKAGDYESIGKRLKIELDALNIDSYHISGNNIFDTLISYKKTEAGTLGITIDYEYRNISEIRISGIDLAVLLGNAIDNAVEACAQLTDPNKKKVGVMIVVQGEMVIITVENYVEENIDVCNLKTTKKNSRVHGFGIINMNSVAKKYNGEVAFECENNVFKTIIMVENP